MKNIVRFEVFEAVEYPYTREDVKRLPSYKVLEALGFYDATTDRIWANGNMRIYNDILYINRPGDCITIYGNGPIRKTVSGMYTMSGGAPHILKRFSPITSLSDWASRFTYLIEWTRKRYKKAGIEYNLNNISSSGDILKEIYKQDLEGFLRIYKNMSPESRSQFLNSIGKTEREFQNIADIYMRTKDKSSWI